MYDMEKLVKLIAFVAVACVFQTGVTDVLAQEQEQERNIYLPETDFHLSVVRPYVEWEPDPDYQHASEAAHEAFRDVKFSVRLHWGIYSIRQMNGESDRKSVV
jgi:hypothetical protein